jgi:hypothetical protein
MSNIKEITVNINSIMGYDSICYDLTGKRVSYFLDFLTQHHVEPFSVYFWTEDFCSDVLNDLPISPMLVRCEVTHLYNVKDPRFFPISLGCKYHAKDIIGDWKYTGEKKLLLICQSYQSNPQRLLFPPWAKGKDWVTFQPPNDIELYFKLLQQHYFIVCPSGFSVQCYRFFEAIESGCIPIADGDYYDGLGYEGKYLKVDDFFSITEEFLTNQLTNFNLP